MDDDNSMLRARIEKLKVGKNALRNERDYLRRKNLEVRVEIANLEIKIDELKEITHRARSYFRHKSNCNCMILGEIYPCNCGYYVTMQALNNILA